MGATWDSVSLAKEFSCVAADKAQPMSLAKDKKE